ncbi:MAG: CoB--CoM heterodisulfide reductase iron-sulfur subunit A family protein [bacterium]|nr:CoB--CoM heterodisulfide reductase iron-sulfur subunit A family protein [bacterium]
MGDKVGVFICHCGGNISKYINMEELTKYALTLENVPVAENYIFMCSEAGQDLIKDKIAEYNLDRVVVASCSPKFHEPTFRRTLQETGLNPYYLAMANIREHCSFPHSDEPDKALQKAKDLVRGAVARAKTLEPIEKKKQIMNKDVLVVGAGIAGIQASLDLADAGFKVYLVEKDASIGGNMPKVLKTFPTDDCAMCTVSPKMNEVAAHKNIEILSYAELRECNGSMGNFEVVVEKKARLVDERKCVGCGDCMAKCPSKTADDYNQIGQRKAIYIPFPNALPKVATIDTSVCLQITKGKCGVCKKICPADAVDYEQKSQMVKLNVGAIIVATGYKEYDPSIKGNYGYGRYPNIITQMQLARMMDPNGPTEGKIIRPSDNKEPKRIVMVQCMGSRDDKPTGRKYCSRVCCMIALKHANLLKRDCIKDSQIDICYMDIRAFGKGYEEYYQRVQDLGVRLTRGRPGEIIGTDDGSNNLIVRVEDTFTKEFKEIESEMVVLSCATDPSDGTKEVAKVLGIATDDGGFIKEFHPKLRPVDTSVEGIFVAGAAQGPKDIPDAVAQASGAAARTMALLSSDIAEISLDKALVNKEECKGCDICEKTCPFDAITMVDLPEGRKAVVSEALCHGCGMCAANCPTGAMQLRHYKDNQVLAEVGALIGSH